MPAFLTFKIEGRTRLTPREVLTRGHLFILCKSTENIKQMSKTEQAQMGRR